MWWLLATLLTAEPVHHGASAMSFNEALAAADSAVDLAGLQAAALARRTGLERLGSMTSNPMLTLQPGLRIDTATPGPEGLITLSQSFNLGGLGSARKAAASEEAEVASLQARAMRYERRVAAAMAWLDAWAAQSVASVANEEARKAHELLEKLERGLSNGNLTRVEVATARAFAAEADALHLEWQGRRLEAGARLSTLLGLESIAEAHGPLPTYPTLTDLALEGTGTLPTQVLTHELAAERRRDDETRAHWASALQLSLQAGREVPNQWFGNVGIGVTLPLFERGERERIGHQATLKRLSGEAALSERRVMIARELAIHELEHSAQMLTAVKSQQLPAAEEAAALEAQRYASGEATLLEVTLLRRQALSARIAATVAEARFALARAVAHEILEAR